MFRRDQDRERFDIAGRQVRHLYRSVGDVQLAMAGLPSQEATAYVFSYAHDGGLGAAVILHLKESRKLALYFPESRSVGRKEIGAVLDEGLHFAESMGFILADLDIHLLDDAKKEAFWQELPLNAHFSPSPVAEADKLSESGEAAGKCQPAGSTPVPIAAVAEEPVPPTPQEMAAGKKRLVENLGRFLASL